MKRLKFTVVLAALSALGLAAGAQAATSDSLTVYDGTGKIVEQALLNDAGENSGQIISLSVAIDAAQFGNATILLDPGPAPQNNSDIFGICFCNGGQFLSFASDDDHSGVSFGAFPRTFLESGPISATLYLDPALQAQGYTAWFVSDSEVPEPASWALMLAGFGLVGTALRSRSAVKA